MKTRSSQHRRALAALVPATLLLALPAIGQDVAPAAAPPIQTTTVAPPPVAQTLSAPPAGPASVASAPAGNGIGDPNSATPIAPEAIAQVEESRRTAAPARSARMTASRAAPVSRAAPPPVPPVIAPVAAPVTAVPDATPAPVPPADVTPADVTPAPAVRNPADTAAPGTTDADTTRTDQGAPIWPFVLGALVVLGGLLAFFLLRRRRPAKAEYDEEAEGAPADIERTRKPAAVQPDLQYLRTAAPVAAVAAASDATEDASIAEPEAHDVEALTAGDAPVADRPWLEFAMRPVRAGSNVDEALVEIELTVGNSGNIAAEDVRISTFMFVDGSASEAEMERLLVERGDDGVAPVTIEPGAGTRIDATLGLLKRDLAGDSFSPVVMADARYRLPDGSEGRTSATFSIGLSDDSGSEFAPISIVRPQMHQAVEARLQGTPERV